MEKAEIKNCLIKNQIYKIFVFIVFLCVLSSCVTQRRCNIKYPPSVARDSIYIETVKEIPVIIAGDTVNIEVPIDCPDQELIYMENTRLRQTVRILNGKLISNSNIKTDTVYVKVVETKIVVKEVKVPQPVKYVPRIYKQAMSIVIFIFIAAFVFIGWKAYKFFKPKI